jgi:ferredoxin-NADP reductase
MGQFQTFSVRLLRSTPLSDFTKHLEFEVVGATKFGFVPGQWLSFKASEADGEEITRAYSIASPPREDNTFALCLNRVQDGFMSNFLCDMIPGDELGVQGPFGNFILRPPMRDTIFIATGTGIAPFRSMLHWLLADHSRHEGHQLWLVFGNRRIRDIYYDAEFKRMAGDHPNFRYLPTLSQPDDGWEGLRGYVQEHVPGVVGSHTGMHAYVCGLKKMISANRDLLKGMGWERKQIIYESYD